MRTARDRLTYANVMATLAVFIALGGSSYAAMKVGSKEIRDNSIRSKDVRNKTLRGKDVRGSTLGARQVRPNALGGGSIKESSLGKVPAAADADRVGGRSVEELRVGCPGGTVAKVGLCFEAVASAPTSFGSAGDQCSVRGRVLPTWAQLKELTDDSTATLAPGGEFTSNVYEGAEGQLRVVVLVQAGGGVAFQDALTPAARAYRCVAPPAN